jgi:hypothetical protein
MGAASNAEPLKDQCTSITLFQSVSMVETMSGIYGNYARIVIYPKGVGFLWGH